MKRLPPSSLRSGLYAFGIYIAVVGLLLFYFNSREEHQSKRYVKKDEHRIQVALSGSSKPQTQKQKKPSKTKSKPTQTKKSPKKAVKKKVVKKQVSKKRVIKEKVVKKKPAHKKVKKKDVNKSKKPKKRAAKDLFANVKTAKKKKMNIQVHDKPVKSTPKKKLIKMSNKPVSATARINNSLKNQKSMQSGVESNYLAAVQSMLEDWPAQHDYAGEKVKVLLYIDPTGNFEFKITSASRNPDFNRGLTEYLEQLQEFGFGRHKGGRTYEFEAEFVAKE